MISIDLDEKGQPKSSIVITTEVNVYIQMFVDEAVTTVKDHQPNVKTTLLRGQMSDVGEKSYRMGVAQERKKYTDLKSDYDKMSRLVGALIGANFDVRRAKTLEEAQESCKRVLEGSELPTIEQINEQRASFAYGQLALTSKYHDATPEELENLKLLCRQVAGCKT